MTVKTGFKKLLVTIGGAVPLAFLLLPILGLIYGGISGRTGREDVLALILPAGRRLDLFERSLMLSLLISVTDLVLALASALGVYRLASRNRRAADALCLVSIFMLLLPSFIHSQGWWRVFEILGLPTSGLAASWWVSAMFFLPLPFILIFLSLRAADREVLEAGAVFLSPGRSLLKVVLPSVYPALFGSSLLVFLLSLGDYSIASIFSVNVYSLDISAQFSVSGSVFEALLYSLPLAAVSFALGAAGLGMLRGLVLTSRGEKGRECAALELPKPILVLSVLGLLLLLVSIVVPWGSILLSLLEGGGYAEGILSGMGEFLNTVLISLCAAVISVPMALILGLQLNGKRLPYAAYFILLMPLIMPSPLIGIGLIGALSRTSLYGTAAMPVLAAAVRYTTIGAVLCFSGIKSLDREVISAGLVYQKSGLQGFLKLRLPMILPFALMSGFIVFILSSGEVGASVMILPPGFNSLAVKIYNYLHYGASDMVAALCSLLVGFAALSAVLGAWGASYLGRRSR